MIEITTLSELTIDGKLALRRASSSKELFDYSSDELKAVNRPSYSGLDQPLRFSPDQRFVGNPTSRLMYQKGRGVPPREAMPVTRERRFRNAACSRNASPPFAAPTSKRPQTRLDRASPSSTR